MHPDFHIFELGQRRIRHGIEGFASGIRNQMDMKFVIHRSYPQLARKAEVKLGDGWG
jgi:hypothetical protein